MNNQTDERCTYIGRSGNPCPHPVVKNSAYCFWHDPTEKKSGRDIKAKLERMAGEGRSLEGFLLRSANLRGVNLTFGSMGSHVDLRHADLSRADLSGAHLFNIDLRGSNLMKADLSAANLNRSRLEDTNLLGAELENARLEQVDWGRHLRQETLAREAGRHGRAEVAMDLYLEAEEIYRSLTSVTEGRGHFHQAGHFYQKEKIMRRMQMRRMSREWLWSKLVDLLCGYGEKVERVIGFALGVILVCSVLFFLLGIKGPDGAVVFRAGAGLPANLADFLVCVYYSVVTFTTLGYGDYVPINASQAIAAIEAFIGAFAMSLFVVVFIRKMSK